MAKKKYEELFAFVKLGSEFLERNKEKETKIKSILEKLLGTASVKGTLTDSIKSFYDAKEDLDLDNCSVDDRGNIIRDDKGNLTFTVQKFKTLKEGYKKLAQKEINLPITYINDIDVSSLSEDEKIVFKGFVFK